MEYLGLVLSGEFELCVSNDSDAKSFIRNACWSKGGGGFTALVSHPVPVEQVEIITSHNCVVKGYSGALDHYHTRRFPVKGRIS